MTWSLSAQEAGWVNAKVNWSTLPPLPDAIGFAGPYVGVSNGALIVAGGANFPDRPPWEAGAKVWHDRIFVLERPKGEWRVADERLPAALGYGVSITTPRGVLCIGGGDAKSHVAEVFLLEWREGRVARTAMASLPLSLANAAGAMAGNVVYVAGGTTAPDSSEAARLFFALDLSDGSAKWKTLESWPGPERMLAVAGGRDGAFFLFSGARLVPDGSGKTTREYLKDAYRYEPASGWKRLADLPRAAAAAPTPAPAVGPGHLLVIGGDDGAYFFGPTQAHGGFSRDILAYHTITNTWIRAAALEEPRAVTSAVWWSGRWVIPSGEVRAGVRSADVLALRIESRKGDFGWLNYAMLGLYPLVMLGITYMVGRKRTSDEFFRGGQRIPWWAAGLSIYATMLSSITFMAIPAKAYASNWSYFITVASIVAVAPIVAYVYLPFYRQLDVTSAYEYLERRFNLPVRWFGSISFLILQLGRTAIVLFLPALAMATVTQFHIVTCIIVMGTIAILMTFLGGIESVIWTDVAQSVILLAGALLSLVFIVLRSGGEVGAMVSRAAADRKFFEGMSWGWDWAAGSIPVIFFGYLLSNLIPYTAQQDVVQRYLTTKNEKQAARAIFTNALISVPSSVLFFAVGTALYIFYKQQPGRIDPQITNNDAIFPLFMVSELPAGVAGLVVAGIFAAAQPTSNLNSMATAAVTDFYQRMHPGAADRVVLRLAQILTVVFGVFGIGAALLMVRFDIHSLWDLFLQLIGLTGGALAGLFALGIFTTRAHGTGAVIGAAGSALTLLGVWYYGKVNLFLYAGIGIVTCFAVGYVASVVIPARRKPLEGLTVFTLRPARIDS